MRPLCKILISYHKKNFLLKDEILTPVHAGRANALKKETDPQLHWLLENMAGDNSGQHISEKNGSFNELTTVYWAWKNYDSLGDPEWIGFMHYRRHFLFKGGEKAFYENDGIYPGYLGEIGYSPDAVAELLSRGDFVSVKPQLRSSLYEHYQRNHRIEDLDRVIDILKEKYPEYAHAADTYLQGSKAYFCNMFIFRKETFFRYAAWIFDILFEFEKRVDLTRKRLFVSEWLTGIFIQKLLEEDQKGVFLPTVYAEEETVIPVVTAFDENYVFPAAVTIASLLVNAHKNTRYDIYLLVPSELPQLDRLLIKSYENTYPNCKITFIAMADAFHDAKISISHITKVTYYRLLILQLLPQYNKVLYLDVDLVANEDLKWLYRTNVDDFYLAGVQAAGYLYPLHHFEREKIRTGLPDLSHYVNAGVLVMNLKRMREDGLQERLLALSKQEWQSQDQDILNVACYNNIKNLPLRFNLMTKYLCNGEKGLTFNKVGCYGYSENDRREGLSKPAIIHFADKSKPWNNPDCHYREIWWKYSAYTPYCRPEINEELAAQHNARLHAEQRCTQLQKEIAAQHNARLHAEQRCTQLQKEIAAIKATNAYRIGCKITFLPRKMRGFLRCVKENGFAYSAKYLCRKLKNRLKR